MHLHTIHRTVVFAHLGTMLLLAIFCASVARVPLLHTQEPIPNRISFSAVLSDVNAGDQYDRSCEIQRLPFMSPDGQFFGLVSEPVRVEIPFAPQMPPADVVHLLPLHFVFTQLTSSSL